MHEHITPLITGTGAVAIAVLMAVRRPLASRRMAQEEQLREARGEERRRTASREDP